MVRFEDFKSTGSGRPIKIEEDCWAFVPDPLPPVVSSTWELSNLLSEADRAVSQLAGIARTLPNPHLLMQPFITREAILSSQIEGIEATISDVVLIKGDGTPEQDSRRFAAREVLNYMFALEDGLKSLDQLPLSLRVVRQMHAILMEGVRGENMSPGDFRKLQNFIGPPGAKMAEATYIPPPVPDMHDCLNDLEKYWHQTSNLPPLIRISLVHYQFEAIHPFLDGNGRIGRLLISLMLCAEKILPQPLLYLSAFFERNRKDYYRLLLAVSQEGAWDAWLSFFLRGVAHESRDAVIRAQKLQDLWQQYRHELQSRRASSVLLQTVDLLFDCPAITVGGLARSLQVTVKAAQLNIDKLIAMGIVNEITGRPRNRVFQAIDILKILE